MEFSNHGGGDMSSASGTSSKVSFFYLPPGSSNNTSATVAAASPPATAVYEFRNYYQILKAEGTGPSQYATKQMESVAHGGNGDQGEIVSTGEMDRIKAKIMSHPQYSSLLGAYLECQKVLSLITIMYNLASNGFLIFVFFHIFYVKLL
jgi:KNOX1 domain